MDFLSAKLKESALPVDVQTATLADAIRAVHDTLQFAGEGAEVTILCHSLHYRLRETLWAEVCRSTFADQIEHAISTGASVQLLLANDLHAEVVSARVLGLADRYPAERFDIYSTGKMAFFDTFPHFTMVRNGNHWYDYIEWQHRLPREPADWDLAGVLDAKAYFASADARKFGRTLKGYFDVLFEKAKSSAATGRNIAAYSPAS